MSLPKRPNEVVGTDVVLGAVQGANSYSAAGKCMEAEKRRRKSLAGSEEPSGLLYKIHNQADEIYEENHRSGLGCSL